MQWPAISLMLSELLQSCKQHTFHKTVVGPAIVWDRVKLSWVACGKSGSPRLGVLYTDMTKKSLEKILTYTVHVA